LAIQEKALGPDHPAVAALLSDLALLNAYQGRYTDAEPLYNRSLAIDEKALGPDHPYVAALLDGLALLYNNQGRYSEAISLAQHALAIREKALGLDHPDVARSLNSLAFLYNSQGRYADALRIVQKTISQNTAITPFVALGVLYGSQSINLITSAEALEMSYKVLQRSLSSGAGKAVSMLAARFAAGSSELAQLVREDQDVRAESDRPDTNIRSVLEPTRASMLPVSAFMSSP
jgi:tetratricopeptide (TPR) repeat protein